MKKLILAGVLALSGLFAGAQSADSINVARDTVVATTGNILKDTVAVKTDLIIFRTGEEIKCKVTEITAGTVIYSVTSNGVNYSCAKDKVLLIIYANGMKEIFKQDPIAPLMPYSPRQMYDRGVRDATLYYKAKQSGAGGTMAAVILVGPLFGLIPAIACASSEPMMSNLIVPEQSLLSNMDYSSGYIKTAHKIKKKKIWGAYGGGCAVLLGAIAILTVLSF